KLAFLSARRRITGMHVLNLQKPAAPNAPLSSEIDWDDIHLRVEQPAPIPAEEGAISPDPEASYVAFRSGGPNGDDLWVASSSGGHLSRLTTGNLKPQQIQWSNRIPGAIYFRDGDGHLRRVQMNQSEFASMMTRTPPGQGNQPVTLGFHVKMTIRQDEEF